MLISAKYISLVLFKYGVSEKPQSRQVERKKKSFKSGTYSGSFWIMFSVRVSKHNVKKRIGIIQDDDMK